MAFDVTSVNGTLWAVRPDGTKKWSVRTGGITPSSPVLGAEGNIYVGVNQQMCAFTSNGSKKWEFPTLDMIDSAAAICADGTVLFTSRDHDLYAADSDGKRLWHVWLQGPVLSSPNVAADGVVYVLSFYRLHALQGSARPAASPWPMFRGNPRHTGRVALGP